MSRRSVIWVRLQLQILILVPAAAAVICGGAAAAPQDFILRPAISPALSLLILTSKKTKNILHVAHAHADNSNLACVRCLDHH